MLHLLFPFPWTHPSTSRSDHKNPSRLAFPEPSSPSQPSHTTHNLEIGSRCRPIGFFTIRKVLTFADKKLTHDDRRGMGSRWGRGWELEHRHELSLVFRMWFVILAVKFVWIHLADAFFPLYPPQPPWDLECVCVDGFRLLYKSHCLGLLNWSCVYILVMPPCTRFMIRLLSETVWFVHFFFYSFQYLSHNGFQSPVMCFFLPAVVENRPS